ncbi:MAG: hypothetical protein KME11_04990 [Timaviella obliquedivisa GSE-PSE-MK23-08B]|jgi:hypothetical protein|nr:hypothetical protein [Timaviella obliquedivisa GSE-PSE-MK23-08B]
MSATFVNVQAAAQEVQDLIRGAATNRGSFTYRSDFQPEITDYLNRDVSLWSRIKKVAATDDVVKEIVRTGLPSTGFANKNALETSVLDQTGVRNNLSDTGQEVKAIMGRKAWGHYERSLYEQQGRPYGDQVAIDTADMIASATKNLERALFVGNATTNPLEFNGIYNQIIAGRTPYLIDITGAEPDNVGSKLVEYVTRSTTNRTYDRKITAVYTSGCGWYQIQKQVEDRRLILQDMEFTPGVMVKALMTPYGLVPIVMSPFIDDEPGATVDDPDILPFWLLDEDQLEWHGVVPFGGENTFEPQLFEVSTFVSNVPLTESRLLVAYGTLKAKTKGDCIWRVNLRCDRGTAWSYTA